jgi:hypothetical protein
MQPQWKCAVTLSAACAAMSLGSSAFATLSQFHWDRPDPLVYDPNLPGNYSYMDFGGNAEINNDGGVYKSIDASYDSDSEVLTWSVTFEGAPDGSPHHNTMGFWLVLSDGAIPTGMGGETAQFFFDASQPTPVLTAYSYNGSGAGTSWKDATVAQPGNQTPDRIFSSLTDPSVVLDVSYQESSNLRTMSFSIDASIVNSHVPSFPSPQGRPWDGVGFGDTIGVWFHALTQVQSTYSNGYLSSFSYGRNGWWDGTYLPVPEPGSICLLAAAAGYGWRRKRR